MSEMPHILVFDSGVGGLSVAAEIASLLPGVRLSYLCDDGFFPYGTKEESALIERVPAIIAQAAHAIAPDLVVVACNTASTVALPALRARITQPVVGVVPAIKPAAAQSHRRIVGLLGTTGTVRRAYTQDLIDQFAADCEIIRIGSAELVEIAEEKLAGHPVDPARLAAILEPFFGRPEERQPDTVVLACTHFPLLRAELAACAGGHTRWIDSGAAIARRAATLLGLEGGMPASSPPERLAIFTAEATAPEKHRAFARHGFVRTAALADL
jgi:glutamate racemase